MTPKAEHSSSAHLLLDTTLFLLGARFSSGPPARLLSVSIVYIFSYHQLTRTDKYGWQSSIALLALVIILTVLLRVIDVRVLRPKRIASANAVTTIDNSNKGVDVTVRVSDS